MTSYDNNQYTGNVSTLRAPEPKMAATTAITANTVYSVILATSPQTSHTNKLLTNLKSLFPTIFDARFRKPTVKSRIYYYIRTKSNKLIKILSRRYLPS